MVVPRRKSNLVALRQPAGSHQPLSDEAVALACASGDSAAVAELFDRFHKPVARYLCRILVDRGEVEDCLQATFLEVARGKTGYQARSSVSTWLFGIATNVVRHQARSAGRRARLGQALRLVTQGVGSVTLYSFSSVPRYLSPPVGR